ncbi:hypothetical protein Syun_003041 [Stephania yunnanensis]|uniref:Uncharacterized protein n=1 Tax=Stephania yunnanensis TaxID=152371 RepID=A0AAP0L2G7_9MAGN
MGAGAAERFAFYGASSNLMTYLTGPLGQSTAAASENINAWTGAACMLPIFGGIIADSGLGRYNTILASSILYVMGLGLLTISVTITSSSQTECRNIGSNVSCDSASNFQLILFFTSMYLVAIAEGGHKPCIEAFGADQFDSRDAEERKSKSSFFNWWACALATGTMVSYLTLFYIQENLSWGLGLGIPCIAMSISLAVFLLGTKSYRKNVEENDKTSVFKIARVLIAAVKNLMRSSNTKSSLAIDSHQYKNLDSAHGDALDGRDSERDEAINNVTEVDEAKEISRLVPVWFTCLPHAIIFAQATTFFTKQGSTMDRSMGPNFQIPAATLLVFSNLSIILFIPIYDRVFIPLARAFTRNPSGITTLQRIGLGMIIYVMSMAVAALVETRRLKIALDYGLVDDERATVPMSIWWLVPQYLLSGLGNVFTPIGLQELFYDQVPFGLRSLGISLFMTIFGVGNFLSSLLISILERATSEGPQGGWFANNLNKGHLDYFYWFLFGLSSISMVIYVYVAKSFIYKRWN